MYRFGIRTVTLWPAVSVPGLQSRNSPAEQPALLKIWVQPPGEEVPWPVKFAAIAQQRVRRCVCGRAVAESDRVGEIHSGRDGIQRLVDRDVERTRSVHRNASTRLRAAVVGATQIGRRDRFFFQN